MRPHLEKSKQQSQSKKNGLAFKLHTSTTLDFHCPSTSLLQEEPQNDREFKADQQTGGDALSVALVGFCVSDSERPAWTQRQESWVHSYNGHLKAAFAKKKANMSLKVGGKMDISDCILCVLLLLWGYLLMSAHEPCPPNPFHPSSSLKTQG